MSKAKKSHRNRKRNKKHKPVEQDSTPKELSIVQAEQSGTQAEQSDAQAEQGDTQTEQSSAQMKQGSILEGKISFVAGIISVVFTFINIADKPSVNFKVVLSLALILLSAIGLFCHYHKRKKATTIKAKVPRSLVKMFWVVMLLLGFYLSAANFISWWTSKERISQEVENGEQQMLAEAELYYNGKQYESLVELYTSEELLKNSIVLNNLGYMYSKGIYFNQDFDTAVRYYELASNQGSSDAVHNLISLQLHNCATFEEVVNVLNTGYYSGDNGTFLFLGSILQGEELSDTTMTEQMRNTIAAEIESFFASNAETQIEILSASLGPWQHSTMFSDNVPHGGGNIYEQYTSLGTSTVYGSKYSYITMYNYLKSTRTFVYDDLMQEHFVSVIDPN